MFLAIRWLVECPNPNSLSPLSSLLHKYPMVLRVSPLNRINHRFLDAMPIAPAFLYRLHIK